MSKIVVLGGGMIGLSTALMLAKQGHEVTVLEQDGAPVPGSPERAWQEWDRHGVAQFRQPHYLHPAGCHILATWLPEVKEALLRAHGTRFDVLTLMPPGITDRAPRAGDDRFVTVTGRRPVLEFAVAAVAEQRVEIRRGTCAARLLTGACAAAGVPHVAGVRLPDGQELAADLVVDAMGRRSLLPGWLTAIGARPPAEDRWCASTLAIRSCWRAGTTRCQRPGCGPGTGTRSSWTGRGRSRSTRPSTGAPPGLRPTRPLSCAPR
jgi:flavin-dependent dehydrogenase